MTALDWLPWLPFPAVPLPYVTIFLPDAPACHLLAPAFSPCPLPGAAGPSEALPLVSAVAPPTAAPPPVTDQRAGEPWDSQSDEPPFLSSRGSSPLQLDLLQEDLPGACASAEQVRAWHPEREREGTCSRHTTAETTELAVLTLGSPQACEQDSPVPALWFHGNVPGPPCSVPKSRRRELLCLVP